MDLRVLLPAGQRYKIMPDDSESWLPDGPLSGVKVLEFTSVVVGPNVNYPMHYHGAEEVYCLLSSSADFRFDEGTVERKQVGDAVHMRSMRKHGFRALDKPLVIFYIWRSGNLREKSTFV